ncbi:MAG: phosphoglycerate kinase, partial [Elusimicrobiota bacterium]
SIAPFAVLPLALAAQAVFAQAAPPAAPASAPAAAEAKDEETNAAQRVIVTGVAKKTLKKDSTNTVNTFTAEEIRRLAPISTADLLQNVPGIFAEGSTAIAKAMAEATLKGAITIVGGGDSLSVLAKPGMAAKMSHCSTGGGASLELLKGNVLPGLAALAAS